MFIKEAKPILIKNSRGEQTIKLILDTYKGFFSCSAPSGKSTGSSEVPCYNKQGIKKSFDLFKQFCYFLQNKNFIIKSIDDLNKLNSLIKRFENKYGELGGNIWYVLQGAFLRAAARDAKLELWEFIHQDISPDSEIKIPMPVGNCIGGGLHTDSGKKPKPDFQEFLLIPEEKTFSKAVAKNIYAHAYAKKLLKARKKNDENAWITNKTNEEVLYKLSEVAEKYGLRIGLDVAASSFFRDRYYYYKNKRLHRDRLDQIDYITKLIEKYNVFYVEDPMDEEEFNGFKEIMDNIKRKRSCLIVGDDLTTTNFKRTRRAIRAKSINAIIIKPNQIGSINEVKDVVALCKKNDIKIIFSHRSGETMDNTLSDYAIGFGADFIKCGIIGPERLIKLKRIMDIEKKTSQNRRGGKI